MGISGTYFGAVGHGIGAKSYFVNARAAGMGNAGLASLDTLALSQYAPAQWLWLNDTRISVGLEYYLLQTQSNGLNIRSSSTNIMGFNFAVPIERHHWVVGLSVQPYTLLDAQYQKHFRTQAVDYSQTVVSRGSLTKGQFIVGWRPWHNFAFAVAGNYYFGALQDKFQLEFNSGNFYNASHQVQYRLTGIGAGLFAQANILKPWHLGGFWEWRPRLWVKKVSNSILQRGQEWLKGKKFVPVQGGLGSAFYLGRRWLWVADFIWQKWSDGFGFAQQDSLLEDWYHIGVGFEHALKKGRHVGFFHRIDWRFGFSVEQLGYRFRNHSVHQYAFHFGVGIPLFFYVNRLDVAFIGGIRGNRTINGAEERFFRAQFTISMGERWFQRFR